MFDFAAQSMSQTIRPNAQNAALIREARREVEAPLADITALDSLDLGVYIGVHIRRGDRKAEAWPHLGSYVPVDMFGDAVVSGWNRLLPASPLQASQSAPVIWISTDSPEAHKNFTHLSSLPKGTKLFSLARSSNEELRTLASPKEYDQSEFVQMAYEDRVRLTRGAIIDFAMLSGMWVWEGEARPMATVCTLRYVLTPTQVKMPYD